MSLPNAALHVYSNVGIEQAPSDDRYFHLYVNVGVRRPGVLDEVGFFYQYANVTDDQPRATITWVTPDDLLVPGENAVLDGWNFEGRDDGGDMQPVVRFYAVEDITAWHVDLTVISWDLALVPGATKDQVTVLLPLQLPAVGYLVIEHLGPDANPYQSYSNFFAVGVDVAETTLDLINFDDDTINWATSAAFDSYFIGHASLSKKLYVTSKRGAPWSFNGVDIEELVPSGFVDPIQTPPTGEDPDPEEILPSNSFPKGHFAARKHDRMWVANVQYADGTHHKSRLHYSAALSPEVWWADDFVDFDPDDGQEITGLISYGEGLMVFKNHNIQILTGMSEASFSRQTLISNTGTVSPYTIAIVGGMLYFMDRDSGVWMFDGAQFTPISDAIRTYLLEGCTYGAMFTASGFSYRNQYVLSVPWEGATAPTRSFVYDTTTQAWTEYDFGIRDATAARDRVYSVTPRNETGVYQMNEGETDAGSEIAAEFETPWIAPGGHSNKHRTRRIDMAFANLGGAVTIGQYNDFDPTAATHETTEVVSDPSSDQVLNLLDGFSGTRWETMQLKVENVAGSDFQLNRVTLLWTALDRKRGVYG